MERKPFAEFMAELNGANLDDRALLDLLFYQTDRVYRESGNPISYSVRKLTDGYALNIYAKVHGRFFLYEFATSPCFSEFIQDGMSDRYGEFVYSCYRETECQTRDELVQLKRFIEGLDHGISKAEDFYPQAKSGIDTKKLIDGFYDLWTRKVPDLALRSA